MAELCRFPSDDLPEGCKVIDFKEPELSETTKAELRAIDDMQCAAWAIRHTFFLD